MKLILPAAQAAGEAPAGGAVVEDRSGGREDVQLQRLGSRGHQLLAQVPEPLSLGTSPLYLCFTSHLYFLLFLPPLDTLD